MEPTLQKDYKDMPNAVKKKFTTLFFHRFLFIVALSFINLVLIFANNEFLNRWCALNFLLLQEKGSTSGRVDERNESGFIGREGDCTELKKRGLCLVPFSMVANYFG